MEKFNIKILANRISERRINGNKGILDTFDDMKALKIDKTWKKKFFYDSSDTEFDYKEWSRKDFNKVLTDLTEWSIDIYTSIESILTLDQGRELFLKYGRERMVTYFKRNDDERIRLLELAEEHYNNHGKYPTFNYLCNKEWSDKKRKAIDINNKKESLVEENKRLKKKVKDLENKLDSANNKIIKLETKLKSYETIMEDYLSSKNREKEN